MARDEVEKIAGFDTLAATSAPFDLLPANLTKRLPPYPVIPAMSIERLAVAEKYHGRGLGHALIADAANRNVGL